MKQDEKGGKRSADGVGESKHAGRLSGRATGDYPCAPTAELIQGFPCHPRTLHWLGRLIRSIVGLTLAVNLGRWGLWAGFTHEARDPWERLGGTVFPPSPND